MINTCCCKYNNNNCFSQQSKSSSDNNSEVRHDFGTNVSLTQSVPDVSDFVAFLFWESLKPLCIILCNIHIFPVIKC